MLKDDLQACLMSGYSFIGCSKFDQVDGYFGPGATKCHYTGVAEIAFAQGACTFVETCTGSLQICTGFHKGLAQARTRAGTFTQACTKACTKACTSGCNLERRRRDT